MQVIVHCGAHFGPLNTKTREYDPATDTHKESYETARCAAPAGHPGAHTDDYWTWIYEARRRVISEWESMLLIRRVPSLLRYRLLQLIREYYLEGQDEPRWKSDAPSASQSQPIVMDENQILKDFLNRMRRQ